MANVKECTLCKETKPLLKFSVRKASYDGFNSRCKDCLKVIKKVHYESNKERINANKKQYREENKDKISKQRKLKYQENKAVIIERVFKWQLENADKTIYYKNKNYLKNKDKKRQLAKERYQDEEWRLKHKERVNKYYASEKGKLKNREKASKRRNIQSEVLADFTREQWIECLKEFDNSCAYCGAKENLEQEHVIPLSKGGGYTVRNIVPACKKCNSSKSNKNLEIWYPLQTSYTDERHNKILKYIGGF